MGVYIPGRRIKVTPRLGLADTALVDSCIPEGLLWYTYQRKFESAPTSARPIVGRQQKVAYETEDFDRVVPRTGSITRLCEAENRDSPYASAVVPRPFTETSSARHPRPRAAWCAGEGATGRLARRSLLALKPFTEYPVLVMVNLRKPRLRAPRRSPVGLSKRSSVARIGPWPQPRTALHLSQLPSFRIPSPAAKRLILP